MNISNMKKVNELFDARVDIIMDNYSSVFTKDDIVALLVSLRTDTLKAIAEEQPEAIFTADKIISAVKDALNEIPFLDFIESEPELCGGYGSNYSIELNTTFDEDEFTRQFITDLETYFEPNND